MKRLIFFSIITSLIFSCGSGSDEVEKSKAKDEQEKKQLEIQKSEKQRIIDELVKKYDILYQLDTIQFLYSLQYKPLIKSNPVLIEGFLVKDIFQKDSIFFVSIRPYCLIKDLIFPIYKEQVDLFLSNDVDKLLVVNINEIKKIKFAFEGDRDGDDVSVSLENSWGFSARGELVEVVSLKK